MNLVLSSPIFILIQQRLTNMSKNYKILVATYPFGKCGRKPLELLQQSGYEIIFNPYGRRLKANEVDKLIKEVDAVIAGTEPYSVETIRDSNLKVISRVGIGLDNVPLKACKENNIMVTYTPDAPSQAVAELTLCNILNLLRKVSLSDKSVRENAWNRYLGHLVEEVVIGVVGVGRIGKRVIKLLQPFNPKIIACDIKPDYDFSSQYSFEWVSKEEIFSLSDVITIHIPSNQSNHHFVNREIISLMKTNSHLINSSRGNIVDEDALYDALLQHHLAGAALDVFEKEPYEGPIAKLDNVILTAHMGASANKSRYLMELGAAEDCLKFLNGGEPLFCAFNDGEFVNRMI